MALSAKLVMRQGQAMVMTPQLLQAIKLLQLPNIELAAYIENELERNPLLERAEDFARLRSRKDEPASLFETPRGGEGGGATGPRRSLKPTPARLPKISAPNSTTRSRPDRAATPAEYAAPPEGHGLSATSWSGVAGGGAERSGAQSRGLCGGRSQPWRPPRPPGGDRV